MSTSSEAPRDSVVGTVSLLMLWSPGCARKKLGSAFSGAVLRACHKCLHCVTPGQHRHEAVEEALVCAL